jgi:hypothetical protein
LQPQAITPTSAAEVVVAEARSDLQAGRPLFAAHSHRRADFRVAARAAAAATATVIIECGKLARMISSFALPQGIVLKQKTTLYVVYGSRIVTSSLRKGEFFHAPSMQQSREAEVSFDAAGLVINSVLPVALLSEIFLGSPWPRPHGRIFDRDLVCECGLAGPCPALDQMQVLGANPENRSSD